MLGTRGPSLPYGQAGGVPLRVAFMVVGACSCAGPQPSLPPAPPSDCMAIRLCLADFALLCTLYQQAAAAAAVRRPSSSSGHLAVSAEHMPTPDFMWRHSPDLSATRTRSGYNPLLQDYSNTAVFVGSCQWVRACGGGGGSSGGGGGLH